jgi:hypothetical protein
MMFDRMAIILFHAAGEPGMAYHRAGWLDCIMQAKEEGNAMAVYKLWRQYRALRASGHI